MIYTTFRIFLLISELSIIQLFFYSLGDGPGSNTDKR